MATKIWEAGRKLALKDHTREKRFEKYLDWLESWSKNACQKKGYHI